MNIGKYGKRVTVTAGLPMVVDSRRSWVLFETVLLLNTNLYLQKYNETFSSQCMLKAKVSFKRSDVH